MLDCQILLNDDDVFDEVMLDECHDDMRACVACFDDCDDFVDLVVLRDGERTGAGTILCCVDHVGSWLVDADSDLDVLMEDE